MLLLLLFILRENFFLPLRMFELFFNVPFLRILWSFLGPLLLLHILVSLELIRVEYIILIRIINWLHHLQLGIIHFLQLGFADGPPVLYLHLVSESMKVLDSTWVFKLVVSQMDVFSFRFDLYYWHLWLLHFHGLFWFLRFITFRLFIQVFLSNYRVGLRVISVVNISRVWELVHFCAYCLSYDLFWLLLSKNLLLMILLWFLLSMFRGPLWRWWELIRFEMYRILIVTNILKW